MLWGWVQDVSHTICFTLSLNSEILPHHFCSHLAALEPAGLQHMGQIPPSLPDISEVLRHSERRGSYQHNLKKHVLKCSCFVLKPMNAALICKACGWQTAQQHADHQDTSHLTILSWLFTAHSIYCLHFWSGKNRSITGPTLKRTSCGFITKMQRSFCKWIKQLVWYCIISNTVTWQNSSEGLGNAAFKIKAL